MARRRGSSGGAKSPVRLEASRRGSSAVLRHVIESYLIPRLVISRPSAGESPAARASLAEHVPQMTDLALWSDDAATEAILTALHEQGASHDALQLGLLLPAAERLGLLWCDDDVDSVGVMIATGALIRAMRFVSLRLDSAGPARSEGLSVLIAPVPGESHCFGAAMAAEFFFRAGWQVRYLPAPTLDELAVEVRSQEFDVLALSVVHDDRLPELPSIIAKLRRVSARPDLAVIVGGTAFVRQPALVSAVGADATIATIDVAPFEARQVVARLRDLAQARPPKGKTP